MATQADLVRRVLKLLGAFAAGQEPSAEDVETIEQYIPTKIEDLRARKVAYFPDVEDIDDAAVHWLAMLVAQDAAPEFGTAADANSTALAESRLRTIYASIPTYAVQKGCYF